MIISCGFCGIPRLPLPYSRTKTPISHKEFSKLCRNFLSGIGEGDFVLPLLPGQEQMDALPLISFQAQGLCIAVEIPGILQKHADAVQHHVCPGEGDPFCQAFP